MADARVGDNVIWVKRWLTINIYIEKPGCSQNDVSALKMENTGRGEAVQHRDCVSFTQLLPENVPLKIHPWY